MTKDTQDPREVALNRFAIISPLLEPGLDPAEYRARRREILAKGVAERTLSRYLKAYREGGFDGLFPKTRADQGQPRAIPAELLAKAVELKSELPQRSVERVIEILETEGEAGQFKAHHFKSLHRPNPGRPGGEENFSPL